MMNKSQIVKTSLAVVSEILDNGLKYSTWADQYPEAMQELLRYREDLANSIACILCDEMDVERFEWPLM